MRKQIVLAITLGTLFFGNTSLAPAAEPASGTAVVAPQVDLKHVEFTLTKNGQKTQVEKGGLLKISLEGNATTGYSWELENFKPSLLEVTESSYSSPAAAATKPNEPSLVGAPGLQSFVFRAKKIGKSPLVFWYKQPWMDGKPERTLTLNVEIK